MTGNNMCVQYVTNTLIIFKSDFKKKYHKSFKT